MLTGRLNSSMKVERLDGDISRKFLTRDLGFTMKDRFTNIRRNAWVADILAKNDINVVACFTTPTEAMRRFLKSYLGSKLILVFCDCSFNKCMKRDVKGLYSKAMHGLIDNLVGFDIPFDWGHPDDYDIRIDTEFIPPNESFKVLLDSLELHLV